MKRTDIRGMVVFQMEEGTRTTAMNEVYGCREIGFVEHEVNAECDLIVHKLNELDSYHRREASLDGSDNGCYKNRKR